MISEAAPEDREAGDEEIETCLDEAEEEGSIDKGEDALLRNVVEFSQWHVIQGVRTPLRVDMFVNGRKFSQQFVVKMAYNTGLGDEAFAKPVPPK